MWGPVRAEDIPRFLAGGLEATATMRSVRFPWPERLEMAAAWAAPISLVTSLLAAPFWGSGALWLGGLIWALSLAIFISFPLYQQRLRGHDARRLGFIFFDFGRLGLPLLLWALFLAGLAAFAVLHGELGAAFLARWAIASLAVLLVLGIDLAGSTPLYKSGFTKTAAFGSSWTRSAARARPSANGSARRACSPWTPSAAWRHSPEPRPAFSAAPASSNAPSMPCSFEVNRAAWSLPRRCGGSSST